MNDANHTAALARAAAVLAESNRLGIDTTRLAAAYRTLSRQKPVATAHTCNDGAGPVFGRKTPGCPRCDELLAGAKPRAGWGDVKRRFEAAQREAIRTHNCRAAGCGPVCTFGDW